MRRPMFAAIAVAAAPSPTRRQRVVPKERNVHVATQAGQELRVSTYSA